MLAPGVFGPAHAPQSPSPGGYWSDFSKALWQLDNLSLKGFLLHASSLILDTIASSGARRWCLRTLFTSEMELVGEVERAGGEAAGRGRSLHANGCFLWVTRPWLFLVCVLLTETPFHSHFSPVSFPDLGFLRYRSPGSVRCFASWPLLFPTPGTPFPSYSG